MSDDCEGDTKRARTDPAYRRALWIVVLLNLGFGLSETAGGFLAGSEALKADALDFLGDGSITLLGLVALTWQAKTRSKIALTQGLFLALLAIYVFAMAVWRAIEAVPPEAAIMGGIGIIALLINVLSAYVLSRFRAGDAQARAVWLFSRNDALANVGVIAAAVLVGVTRSAWPDLIVAGIIAGLFLYSSREIISDAWLELHKPASNK
ncbi:cation transporter [Asticcacaulis biprosthecium]|uniref:cation transporter n=1 Tax=Asticcacaulis biprosthecium TaxID=76891 RepID=UPI0002FF6031|nr:cation transporter [Asticcacaulis biprosthecium]